MFVNHQLFWLFCSSTAWHLLALNILSIVDWVCFDYFFFFYLFISFHCLPLCCHIIIIPFFLPCFRNIFWKQCTFLKTINFIDPCTCTCTVWWLYFLWKKLEYQAYYLSIFHIILLIIASSRKLFSYDRMGSKLLWCVWNLPSKKKKKKKEWNVLCSCFRLDHLLYVCTNAHMCVRVCVCFDFSFSCSHWHHCLCHWQYYQGTAAGGTMEIVVNGTTGWLHPAAKEGVTPLANNIVKLATHVERRLTMGKKGYERVKERFLEPHMSHRIALVLTDVLQNAKSHST